MEKVLIIGSSYSIRDTFSKRFNSYNVTFLKFRDVWISKKINYSEVIVLSGFHHYMIKKNFLDFRQYIQEYYKFILFLETHCNKLIFISTFIPSKLSFSRIVFFYRDISNLILNRKKIEILSFKKIIDEKNKNKITLKILGALGFNFTQQIDVIKNMNKYLLKIIPNTFFFCLKIKRNISVERILRIIDFD